MVYFLTILLSVSSIYLFYKIPTPGLTDVPNERSMHTKPTKRSAGIFFFIIFWMALSIELYSEKVSLSDFLFFLIPTFFLGILGLIDDLKNLNSRLKLSIELVFIFLFLEVFPQNFSVFEFQISNIPFISNILLTLYIVFIFNLINFMDGLDLYLSITLIFFSLNFFSLSQFEYTEILNLYLLLILSMSGFFIFNFPDASMFMGDSGSLPIGYMIAIAPLFLKKGDNTSDLSLILYMIPVFLLDGVYTLIKRGIEKKNIFSAHKEHFYQRVQWILGWRKLPTLLLFGFLNLIPAILIIFSIKNDYQLFLGIIFIYCILMYLEIRIRKI